MNTTVQTKMRLDELCVISIVLTATKEDKFKT